MRQIRMLRAMRRELETGLRPLLHGHERDPRTQPRSRLRITAPAPDPTSSSLIEHDTGASRHFIASAVSRLQCRAACLLRKADPQYMRLPIAQTLVLCFASERDRLSKVP